MTVPDTFSYEVSFNTQAFGEQPTGVDGPYNSLNMGLYDFNTAPPSVGTDTDPGDIRFNGTMGPVDPSVLYGVMAQVLVTTP